MSEKFGAVGTVEGEGELGHEEAVAGAYVVALGRLFEGEVLFGLGELVEVVGEGDFGVGVGGDLMAEQVHEGGGEDVESEEAEVVAGAEAGDHEALFGFGRGGFFKDGIDAVEVVAGGDAAGSDDAVAMEEGFAGGLDGGDGAGFGLGEIEETADTSGLDEEVVADEVEEGILGSEGVGGIDGVTVAAGVRLGEEAEMREVGAGGFGVTGFVAGPDDDADFFDAGGEDLLKQDGEDGALFAVGADEGLQREGALLGAGGGDDGFFDVHEGSFA